MVVRRESVELSLQDVDFTSGMAKAAASTALLNRELHNLDGSSAKADRSTSSLGDGGIAKAGNSARRSSADLNQFTGRLSLLATAATTLGPALIPIGAVAVPAVTALAGGLGAAVGAVGTAVLAFHGLGGAMQALNAYQLEPTDANLKKLHATLGQMSPAAQDFVMRLDQLEPVLSRLQKTAQNGMFPGLNEGLGEILTLVPRVRGIVKSLATEMGSLGASAGKSLANDADWQAFFAFLKADAAPTLDAFARATGNVVAGLGSILVAFRPLSNDFTSGLLEMSQGFREWAGSMSESDGFQSFVDYIQQNGPQVADLLGSLGDAFVALVQAAAPWGSVMIPVLTDAAQAFAAIADSPVGPVLFEAAAAFLAFNKASAFGSMALQGIGGMWQTLGSTAKQQGQATGEAASDMGSSIQEGADNVKGALESAAGASAKSGGRIAAAMAKVSAAAKVLGGPAGIMLLADASKRTGSALGALEGVAGGAAIGFAIGGPLGAGIGATAGGLLQMKGAADQATSSIQTLNEAIASRDRAQLADAIDAAYKKLGNMGWLDNVMGSTDALRASIKSAETALEGFDAAGGHAGDVAGLFGESIGLTGSKARMAAGDVTALADAISVLSGWLDKRSALRGYQKALDDFTASIKDNGDIFDITREKGRANQEALDGIATSITQVADKMKSPAHRQNFIHGAIADLREMSGKASPQAASAISGVIRQLKALDTTPVKPKKVKVDADTKPATKGLNDVERAADRVGKKHPKVKLDADRKPAAAGFAWLYGQADNANKKHPKVKLDANRAPAAAGFQWLTGQLRIADGKTATPKVRLDAGGVFAELAAIQARMNSLRDRTIHLTTVTNKINAGGGGGGGAHPAGADGMTVPGARHPYGDKVLAYLAPGEEVITNRSGQADRFRPLLKAINAGALADGGTVGHHRSGPTGQLTGLGSWLSISEAGTRISNLTAAQIRHLGKQVDDLSKKNLGRFGKALDKAADATQKRLDAEVQASDSVKGSIRSNLTGDLFGSGGSGSAFSQKFAPGSIGAVNSTLKQQIADARATTALEKQLRARGVSGPALQELIEKGGVTALRSFASSSNADLKSYQSLYGQRSAAVGTAANTGASVLGMTAEIRRLTAVAEAISATQKAEAREAKHRHGDNKTDRKKNAKNTGKAVGHAVSHSAGSARGKRR